MTTTLTPHLFFPGNAAEALEFYRSVLGGDLEVNLYGVDFATQMGDAGHADKVMHGRLTATGGFTISASDNRPGETADPFKNDVILGLAGSAGDQGLRDQWKLLIDGGTVDIALEQQMWGDEYGECRDRFGVRWSVSLSG
ncbi:VOC family protein [Tenggerimyces flavus]|uniref:VOC family protein n=1 Tax=Tenggerimyces flavus TaxID=1708749 RepID=A0ABV7Y7E8_9ACTN|nr:VOC family protein [Tenggerimyces flavus]MBM7784985.1 PhnB protein [Tenggerimyces flavus]